LIFQLPEGGTWYRNVVHRVLRHRRRFGFPPILWLVPLPLAARSLVSEPESNWVRIPTPPPVLFCKNLGRPQVRAPPPPFLASKTEIHSPPNKNTLSIAHLSWTFPTFHSVTCEFLPFPPTASCGTRPLELGQIYFGPDLVAFPFFTFLPPFINFFL